MIRALQLLFGLAFMAAGGVSLYLRHSTSGGLFNPENKEGLWIVVVGLVLCLFGLMLFLMGLSRRAKVAKIEGVTPETNAFGHQLDDDFEEGIIGRTVVTGGAAAAGAAAVAATADALSQQGDDQDITIGEPTPEPAPAVPAQNTDSMFSSPVTGGIQDNTTSPMDALAEPPSPIPDPMSEFEQHVGEGLQDADIEKIAEVEAPTAELDVAPEIEVPEFEAPSIEAPEIDVPEISAPEAVIPDAPAIEFPVDAVDPVPEPEPAGDVAPEAETLDAPTPIAPPELGDLEPSPEPEVAMDPAELAPPEIEEISLDTPPSLEPPEAETADIPEIEAPELDDAPVIDAPPTMELNGTAPLDVEVTSGALPTDLEEAPIKPGITDRPGAEAALESDLGVADVEVEPDDIPDGNDVAASLESELQEMMDLEAEEPLVADAPDLEVETQVDTPDIDVPAVESDLPTVAEDVPAVELAAPEVAPGLEPTVEPPVIADEPTEIALDIPDVAQDLPDVEVVPEVEMEALPDAPTEALEIPSSPEPAIEIPDIVDEPPSPAPELTEAFPEIPEVELDVPPTTDDVPDIGLEAPADLDVPTLETDDNNAAAAVAVSAAALASAASLNGADHSASEDVSTEDAQFEPPEAPADAPELAPPELEAPVPETSEFAPTELDAPPEPDLAAAPAAPAPADNFPRLEPVREAIRENDLERADMLLASLRRDLIAEGDENSPELAELTALAGDHAYAAGRVGGAKWLWKLARQRYDEAGAGDTVLALKVDDRLNSLESA